MTNQQELELYQIKMLFNQPAAAAAFPEWLQPRQTKAVQHFHQSLPQYQPTPLLTLPRLAAEGGVQAVLIKNEAERFGLNAFKALGSSWAIARLLAERLGLNPETVRLADLTQPENRSRLAAEKIAFCTATDGNHGRGVAWAAKLLDCPCHIYLPAGAEPERVQAIAQLGAEVLTTELSYDDTVALARKQAEAHGWLLVQDTTLPGYTEIPKLIIQGYSTMATEIMAQLQQQKLPTPTHIFLQAGVGSMAGGMLAFLAQAMAQSAQPRPKFIILEPKQVNCCYLATQSGNPAASVPGVQQTIMAGLNCGTPCSVVMPLLQAQADCFMACPDFVAAHGMRLANGSQATTAQAPFISGESGAVALGAIALLLQRPEMAQAREILNINANSVMLGINTEGAMAPSVWQKIVKEGACPLP